MSLQLMAFRYIAFAYQAKADTLQQLWGPDEREHTQDDVT